MSALPNLIGQVIDGRYEILQRIGEGGMGVVYKARQKSIDRLIAIKMLNPQMARDPNWVRRFYNEAKACSRLQHPNTIRMFDFGQTREGTLFMTMEFLDGISLREAIEATAPMPATRVLKILIQCCASLSEAHDIGILHRDIKPDNVFLLDLAGSPDHVKVLDFSVAKLLHDTEGMRTQAGVVFGTPQYMSPEQGRGVPLDARSDLYALGILGYEMLTGRVPFSHDNPMNVLQMHLRSAVPALPSDVPDGMKQIVMKVLEKDNTRRFDDAEDMMKQCQTVFNSLAGNVGAGVLPPGAPTAPPGGASKFAPGAGPMGKTMIADGAAPKIQSAAPAAQKTIMADANLLDGIGAGPPPPVGEAPPPMPPQAEMQVVQKTMMLQDSEGLVSKYLGDHGSAGDSGVTEDEYQDDGASIVFWMFCLLTGAGIGVGAYYLMISLA